MVLEIVRLFGVFKPSGTCHLILNYILTCHTVSRRTRKVWMTRAGSWYIRTSSWIAVSAVWSPRTNF